MRPVPARVLSIACASFALAGCGQSGSVPAAPRAIATPGGSVTPQGTFVRFSITFPARAVGTSSSRRPDYISPSIQTLDFTIDGASTPSTVVTAPVGTGSPQTITTTLPIQPGSHSFLIAEYDKNNALLGRVMQTDTVNLGTLNTLNFTLDGQLAKIAIQPPVTPFVEGTLAAGLTLVGCQPETFNAVPEDADGNTIVMPGLVPQIATTSGAAGIVATPIAGTDQFTLEAPAPVTTAVAITAAGTDLDGNAVTSAFDVSALGAFYVADFTAQLVRAFDENGQPLTLPVTSFANISNPMGLTATPCTATASGTVVLTQTSNFAYPYVEEFDMSGNAITLASTAFQFTPGNYIETQPLFPADAAGTILMPNTYSSTVSAFDIGGDALSTASGAYPKLQQPVGIAYDPHNQQEYVTNDGLSTLAAFSSAGAAVANVATNSHPMGVVFDSNNNSLYVASGGTTGAVLDQVAPSPANVAEYSEVPAAVTNTGGFTATSTTAYYTGITFDPYSKELYVSDAGDSSIVAYTEAGATVTLPTGAFSTINATSAPKGDPMALFVP